jgi:hypothetical protein
MMRSMEEAASPDTGTRITELLPAAGQEGWAVAIVVVCGLAIRIYLSLTNYCIAGDGAAYINMAREFAAGDWREPLGAVFSPLYPLLIEQAHHLVPDWEVAGDLVSALLGTGAILSIYLLTREVFDGGRRAVIAAAVAAVHPDLAAYSASVRTEAGYIFLTTTAVWLLLKAERERQLVVSTAAGLVAGAAYLYRTEAIGLIGLGTLYPLAAALFWRRGRAGTAVRLGLGFAAAAAVLVVPYIRFLHAATGHWSIGREFTAAVMFGLGSVAHNPAEWRLQGFAPGASPLVALVRNPGLYLAKVRADLLVSFYNFAQAAGPIVIVLLVLGVWTRGRRIWSTAAEAFLAVLVIFYFCGFALSYTGARFMIHLIPYTLGWVVIGLATLTGWLKRVTTLVGWRMPTAAPAVLVALILLPQTLWPIGYDMRGVRYAGARIAADNRSGRAVVARDGRVAWYAGARFVGLPLGPAADLCGWLAARGDAGYLLIGNHDEHLFAITPTTSCLRFLARYPRYGAGYYDLFAVRPPEASR